VVNGRRLDRAERSRIDAAAEVEGHRGGRWYRCVNSFRYDFAPRPERVSGHSVRATGGDRSSGYAAKGERVKSHLARDSRDGKGVTTG
jgi:hypothetical protein